MLSSLFICLYRGLCRESFGRELRGLNVLRFRKPGVTSKGLYKMKKEYIPEFNPFFYHYDKNEQSKVRIHINKIRSYFCLL